MPKYDADRFDPPAPVAHVSLRSPATGASVSNVPMLIDTGADVTLIPRAYLEQLGIEEVHGAAYEMQSFDNVSKLAPPDGAGTRSSGEKVHGPVPADRPAHRHSGEEHPEFTLDQL